jgi:hypothetical protein
LEDNDDDDDDDDDDDGRAEDLEEHSPVFDVFIFLVEEVTLLERDVC